MSLVADVANALHGVVDPELGIDIIELGLVYQITGEEHALAVTMTTTSDQCPMGEVMLAATRACLLNGWPDRTVTVAYTSVPRWSPAMISELGRDMLGLDTSA
ncbi:MAG: metal-sulfur cluster assembly factor [Dehalococcoidia bacterium]